MGLHSDCMVDLAPGSNIAVVSLGVTRHLNLGKQEKNTKEAQLK